MKNLGTYIDHTLLKATATREDITQLCNEALSYNFYAVCVNSCYVPLAKEILDNTAVRVCSVIGFPLGAMSTEAKTEEAKQAVKDGADEIDMVINLGWLKGGEFEKVQRDLAAVKAQIGNRVLKVILETCYLTKTEIIKASELALAAGADFVKTSTGFGSGGATTEDVKIMKSVVMLQAKVKASGGIRDRKTAEAYISLGVDRIGTSSGIAIVTDKSTDNEHTY